MNKCYRLVWNELSQCWVAAAETARGRGKRSAGTLLLAAAGVVLTLPVPLVWAAPPNPPATSQLPTGGQVVAGQAGIAQAANTLTVTQSSNRAAIDWATFNVGSQARVQFKQPGVSSVTLNRVLDSNPSQIFGQLSANGQVFLSNPAGVYFSPGASVDVGGLVATTHGISNADFMAGSNTLVRNGALGSVVNEGQLTATLGGYIALLAPEVRNHGVVLAQLGTVAMAAGESYALQFSGNRLTDILVTPASIAALVDNGNAVKAPGGLIILSAQAANRLQGGVVNNSASLEASGLLDQGGTIRLAASDRITHSGSITADAAPGSAGTGGTVSLIADLGKDNSLTEVSGRISARGGALGGDGGFIETSASSLQIADSARLDTSASLGLTGSWLIDPKNFSIGAGLGGTVSGTTPSGDISGATLSTALGSSDVIILSSQGSTASGSGDIHVNDAISWTKNTLTLWAARDININAVLKAGAVNDTGSANTFASLVLKPATANGADSAVAGGLVKMGMGGAGFSGRVDFFKADGVTARGGSGFLTLGSNAYTVITSLGAQGSVTGTDLQGMAGNLTRHYALGSNIDASASSSWTNKFASIGSSFSGNFNGLGHTINNLTVKGEGLFAKQASGTVFGNVGLVGGSVSSTAAQHTGSLVAQSFGTLHNAFNSGMAVASTGMQVGGLLGSGMSGFNLFNSFSTGTVNGTNYVGGLLGYTFGGGGITINSSFASGNVTGTGNYVGGLIGILNIGTVLSNTYATGNVIGADFVGGLIGYYNSGTVSNSYAVGRVSKSGSGSKVGAFAGYHAFGTASNNFYDTSINGAMVGVGGGTTTGVSGMTTANMKQLANFTSATAANGNVNPGWDFSSSIWKLAPSLNNGYPILSSPVPCVVCSTVTLTISLANTTKVFGDSNPALPSYSISGSLLAGDSITSLNWGAAALQYLNVGSYAYSTSNLLSPTFSLAAGHSAANYVLNWSANALSVTARPLTVTANTLSKTYGAADPTLGYTISSGSLVNGNTLSGALSRVAGNNVGAYAINQNTLAAGSNYALTYVGANLNITPAPLTLSANAVSKVYDGATSATDTYQLSSSTPLQYTDSLSGGSFTFNDKNAGTNKTITLSGVTVNDGNGGANYSLTYLPNTASSITPRALTISAVTSSKTYDGSDASSATPTLTSGALQTGDSLTDLSEVFDSANAGNRTLSVSGYTLGDGNSGNNYTVTLQTASGNIGTRTVSLSGSSGVSKTYDGTTTMAPGVNGYDSLSGVVTGDVLGVSGSPVFAGADAGAQAINRGNVALSGASAANYTLDWSNGSGTITKATLTMTALDASILLGQGNPAFEYSFSGFVNGETAAALTSASVSRTGTQTAAATYTGVLQPTFTATNYQLNAVPGNFTIVPADTLLVKLANNSRVYGNSNPALLASSAEYLVGASTYRTVTLTAGSNGHYTYDDTLGTTGEFDVTTVAGNASYVGNYTIALSNFTKVGSNFTSESTQAGNLAITPRPVSVSIAAGALSKVYDGSTSVSSTQVGSAASLGNKVGNDVLTLSGTGDYANRNAGTANKSYTLSGLSLGGSAAGNYYLASDTFSGTDGTVTPKALTWLVDNSSSSYGNVASAGAAHLVGAITGDALSSTVTLYQSGSNTVVTPAIRTAAGQYDEKVTALGGLDAANYVLAASGNHSGTLTINPKTITLSPVAISKTYDGNTSYSTQAGELSTMAADSGVVSGDVLTALSLAYTDRNAGSGKTVTASAAGLGDGAGHDASANYDVRYASVQTGVITPKTISVSSAPTAEDKVYDGLTHATLLGGSLGAGDVISGDSVALNTLGAFADAHAGSGKTVNLNYSLSGTAAGNYTLASGSGSTTAAITPALLTMTANDASVLLGQGNPVFGYRFEGFVNGETEAVLSSVAVTRNGTQTAAATYTGVLQPSFSSGNYQLDAVNGNFTIVGADTLLIKLGDTSRVYGDSNPSLALATGAQYLSSGNVLQSVSLTDGGNGHYTYDDGLGTTGAFDVSTSALTNSHVGNYSITLSNFSKMGSNFTSSSTQPGTLSVTPRQATVTAANLSRVYDGSTAMPAATLAVANTLAGDGLALTGVGQYANKNAGTGKAYSFANLQLGGADVDNYFLGSNSFNGSDGVVTARTLSWTVDNSSSTYGTLASAGVARLGNSVAGDALSSTVTLYQTGTSNAVTPAARTAAGLYDAQVTGLSGDDAANYVLAASGNTAGTLTIAPKAITLSPNAISKTYDAGAGYSVQAADLLAMATASGAVVSGDVLSSITLAYSDKNAGSGKTVSAAAASLGDGLGGNASNNYAIHYSSAATGSITPKSISVATAPTASNKVYDGLTQASVDSSSASFSGVITGDHVTLVASGVFLDANAGNARTVALGYALGDVDAGNYSLDASSGTTTASISKAALTMSANNASKVAFHGDPALSASYQGFVNGETEAVLGNPTVTRTGGNETAGTYNGVLVPHASSANYQITAVNGNFTIVPIGALLIKLANNSKVYGDAVPVLSALEAKYCDNNCATGATSRIVPLTLVSGNHYTFDDGFGTTGSFDVSTSATSSTGVGNVAITIANFQYASATTPNFSGEQTQDGALTITQRAATFSASNVSKVYDGTLATSGATLSLTNKVGSDDVTLSGVGLYADKNAASGKAYSFGNITLAGTAAGNYYLPANSLNGSDGVITPRPLNWTVDNSSATYGTQASLGSAHLSSTVAGDSIGASVTVYQAGGSTVVTPALRTAAGLYDQKVTALTGLDAANYVLAGSGNTTGTLTIAPKTITLGASALSKTYDGNTDYVTQSADLATIASISGEVVRGDVLSAITLRYADKNAGSGKTVTASGARVDDGAGNDASDNYLIHYSPAQSGSITAKTISVASAPSAADKVYDGLGNATLSGGTLGGVVSGDRVTLAASGVFVDDNAGTGKTVNLSYTLSGLDAANYSLASSSASASASITPKPLTWVVDNVNTSYGTLTSLGSGHLSGVLQPDVVSTTVTLYQSGTNTVVTPALRTPVGSYEERVTALGGFEARNYMLASNGNTAGLFTIAPKAITLSPGAISKTYDGALGYSTQGADLTAIAAASAQLVTGDVLAGITLAYTDKNAGSGKSVNASAARVEDGAGNDASANYSFSYASASAGSITPKTVSVATAPTAANKVYDGLLNATASGGNFGNTDIVTGDNVTLATAASFVDANAANGKTVNLAYTLGGANAGNYSLASNSGSTTADISRATLTMTAHDATVLLGQGNPSFTYGFSGFVNGETEAALSNVSVTRNGTETAAGTYTGVLQPSFTASNYQLDAVPGNFSITQAGTLLITLGNTSKVYGDALPNLQLVSGAQYLTGGSPLNLTLSYGGNGHYSYTDGLGTSGSFDVSTAASSTSSVGNYSIFLSNFTKLGNNFTTQNTQPGALTITQRAATLTASNVAKVYDGSLSTSGATLGLSNRVGSDDVTLSGTGLYADKNVGTDKSYSFANLSLGGGAAGNYYLSSNTLSGTDGSITPRTLSWSVDNASATYGSTATPGAGHLVNAVAGDALSATVSLYQGANLVTPAARTPAGLYEAKVSALDGLDAGNYELASSGNSSGTLTIAPKALTLGPNAISKTYDGARGYSTQGADLAAIAAASGAVVPGDVLSGITLAYSDRNAGSGKTVSASAASLGDGSGGNATANYTISYASASTGSITPKTISVDTAASAQNKVYDGSTNATLSGGALATGAVVPGDSLSLLSLGSFADANAGTAKTVNLRYVLDGPELRNYTLAASTGTTTADISKAPLTMTANNAAKVIFESDPAFSASYQGFVNGETAAVLSNPNVTRSGGHANAGSYSGVLVPGASSNNYQISTVNGNFTIAPVGVLLIRAANTSKVYGDAMPQLTALEAKYCPTGGCTSGTSIRTLTLTRGGGNSYTFNDGFGTTGSFDVETSALSSSAVGNAPITITHFSSFTAGGSASFASQSTQDGVLTVTPRAATIATSAVSKVYDGALATSGATLSLSNRVGADDISLSGNGFYADKNVGSAKDYSFSNLALDGAAVGNYYLASNTVSGSNASITPRTLSISGSSVANKVYDGSDAASAVAGTLGGLVGTETLLASVTSAHFADAHAGTAKGVVWNYALADGNNGGLASNYSNLASDSSTADITPKILSALLTNSGISKVYDGSNASSLAPTYAVSGFITGDSAATLSHSSASYNSAHVQSASSVSVAGLAVNAITGSNGSRASDYALDSNTLSVAARITPRAVTVTADGQRKTQGQIDPGLSYQSEAQNGNRGRVAGDALAGSLSRAAGESPASYAILQGSVDNSNNPDYAIDFVPAQLLVEAGQSNVAPPPPDFRPTDPVIQRQLPDLRPKSEAQLPPDGPALPATEGSNAALPIDGSRAGIAVSVVRESAQQQEGIINVSVPREMVNAGSGFRFPLPDAVTKQAEGSAPLQVSTMTGEDLPGWLHFDPDSRSFVAIEVPLGALPLRVLVRNGRARWVVVVTERNA